MAIESIAEYRKPGYPIFSDNDREYLTIIEYVGPFTTLGSAGPLHGQLWGDFAGVVTDSRIEPLENPDFGTLYVTVGLPYAPDGGGGGSLQEVTYEIEWADVSRPLVEHPKFAPGEGGSNELEMSDIAQVDLWKEEKNYELRSEYKYTDSEGAEQELSANAKMYAYGIAKGVESYVDKAPILRKTSTYINGYPPSGNAGSKDDPGSFPGEPSGYEWLKSADRSIRVGKKNRWDRNEEWMGAIKVLVDKDEIYWSAP